MSAMRICASHGLHPDSLIDMKRLLAAAPQVMKYCHLSELDKGGTMPHFPSVPFHGKHHTEAVVMILCLVSLFALSTPCGSGTIAGVQSETSQDKCELFNLVARAHKANVDRIRTWKGRVRFQVDEDSIRKEDAVIDFVVDRETLARYAQYVSQLPIRTEGAGRSESVYPIVRTMVKDMAHYRHRDRREVGNKASEQKRGKYVSIIVIQTATELGGGRLRSTDFHPFHWLTFVGKDIEQRFFVFYEPAKQGKLSPGVKLEREGSLVVLTLEIGNVMNQYTVDLDKGACLVAYDGHDGEEGQRITDRWRNTLQRVSGVWIPKQTTYERVSSAGKKSFTRLEWTDNEVNEPIPDGTFTLLNLGAYRGDEVYDQRRKTSYTLTGSEFPVRPGDDVMTERTSRSLVLRLVCGGLGVILLGVAVVWRFLVHRRRGTTL